MPTTLDIPGLALLLHTTPSALRSRLCRNPETLPPAIRIPGSRRPIWLVDDVVVWLKGHQTISFAQPIPQPAIPSQEKRRKGRPTNAERLARARRETLMGGSA